MTEMNGNDRTNVAQGVNPERVRELLGEARCARAEFEASMAAFHASQVGIRVSMSEEQYRLQRVMYSAEHRLSHAAPALAEAYLGSEERLETLTLERDRLAHELRLLQEAVHVPDLEAEQVARRAAEEAAVAAGLPYPCFQAQPAATRDCESDGYYMCEGCGLRISTPEWAEAKERGRLFPLSSDTPERSGGEG